MSERTVRVTICHADGEVFAVHELPPAAADLDIRCPQGTPEPVVDAVEEFRSDLCHPLRLEQEP